MPPDRDAAQVEQLTKPLMGMILAAHVGNRERLIGELTLLLNGVLAVAKSLDEKPDDAALRRAIGRMG